MRPGDVSPSVHTASYVISIFLCLLTASSREIQASPNTNATLPCNVTLPVPANESLIRASWVSNGSAFASFGKPPEQIKEGFSWDTANFINGDFSLTILKAGLGQQGVYECTVEYNATVLHSSKVTFTVLGMCVFALCPLI